MKIRSIQIKNTKKFGDIKINFYDELTKSIRNRTVITGKNGSGKTTLLEVIYSVFEQMNYKKQSSGTEEYLSVPAGVEFKIDFPLEQETVRMVVATGTFAEQALPSPESLFIQRIRHLCGTESAFDMRRQAGTAAEKVLAAVRNAVSGVDDDPVLGNLIYLPTDRLIHFESQGTLANERPGYRWTYKYDRTHRGWEGSIESYLVWRYFRDLQMRQKNPQAPARFEEFKGVVNKLLNETEITTVSEDHRVEIRNKRTGQELLLKDMSSGEKQIVLLVAELFRYLRKGSIVLIDEPEIHLHPVWQRIFIDSVTRLCKQYDAQLIITTQSPQIASFVLEREVITLDDLDEVQEA